MNEENKTIDIPMSTMQMAGNDHILCSSGIGSCIAITLYDPIKKIGALAHPMLSLAKDATLQSADSLKSNLRFVENAVDAMISVLEKEGAVKSRLEAKLVGGAHMFEVFDENPKAIGLQNVEAAKKKLEKEGITIIANDTGGNVGRSVAFELTTGIVEVKTKI